MHTACLKTYRSRVRLAVRVGSGLALAAVASGLAVSPAAVAQNLVSNGTFAITGGASSFMFGGAFVNGGPTNETLAG